MPQALGILVFGTVYVIAYYIWADNACYDTCHTNGAGEKICHYHCHGETWFAIGTAAFTCLFIAWAVWYRHHMWRKMAENGGYEPVANAPPMSTPAVPVATAEPI